MQNNETQYDEFGFCIDNTVEIVQSMAAPSGAQYVKVKQLRSTAWVSTDSFCPDSGPGFHQLKGRGIKVFTGQQKSALLDQISRRTYFPAGDIGEGPGWASHGFNYPDGTVFTYGSDPVPVAYSTKAVCVSAQGTLEEWKANVAAMVRDHHLPTFCLMIAFAAPLLSLSRIQGNYLFMLSGRPRNGKTTCLELLSSVCGPALDSAGGRYYLKFNNTLNRLEEWLPFYADLPVNIDELSSHGSKSSRMTDFRTFVHHLAGVDARGRFNDAVAPAAQTRTIITMTSNDTARELLSYEAPDAAAAVEDRLIEIPVPAGAEGAFNGLEANAAVANAFAQSLRDRIGRYHGTAMPAFIDELVTHRRDDEENLRAGIERRMADFRAQPEVVDAGELSSRILDLTSLVYASGVLAQHYGVLPDTLDCRAAAIHCLRLHLGLRAEADPVARLLAWISANDVADLRGGRRSTITDTAMKERGAVINEYSGVPQLCIARRRFISAFEDHRTMLNILARRGILKIETEGKTKRKTTYTPVLAGGRNARMYVFNLPDFEEWLAANGFPAPPTGRRR